MRLVATFLAALLAGWVAAAPGPGLPPPVLAAAGELVPLGRGEMRWFGFKIYDAALWVPAGAGWSAVAPHALEIRYARAISGEVLVSTSMEELERLGFGDATARRQWRAALEKALPGVEPGDTLIGLYLPGQGARFWHGRKLVGEVADPELARAFFAIWLDPRTREPALRARLLGEG